MPQSLINPKHLCFHTSTHRPGSITALQRGCSANLAGEQKAPLCSQGQEEKRLLAFAQQDGLCQREAHKTGYLVSLPWMDDSIPIQNRWTAFAQVTLGIRQKEDSKILGWGRIPDCSNLLQFPSGCSWLQGAVLKSQNSQSPDSGPISLSKLFQI